MKYLTLLLLIINISLLAQEAKYQTYSADMTLIATQNSEDIQWLNKDLVVNLDYSTGKLSITAYNTDFYSSAAIRKEIENSEIGKVEYKFIGILPIDEILNQKQNNKEYNVELQLRNDDIDYSHTVNLTMSVMRTSQRAGSYRVFTFNGILYNDELQLPAFKMYDNQVEIRIMFNAYWKG